MCIYSLCFFFTMAAAMLGQTNVLEAGASENKGDEARLESFVGAIAIGQEI